MNRRSFIKTVAATPLTTSGAVAAKEKKSAKEIIEGYFDALPETKAKRNDAIINCANRLCDVRKTVSKKTIQTIREGGGKAAEFLRKLQFGVKILNEYSITNAIDETMVVAKRRELNEYTKYLPLIGSLNNLCDAACAVNPSNPKPENLKSFLFATAAFGAEVVLWYLGAPFKMAWRGTRFVSNRTFLRFARHGCRGCIALLMSELHWAIRNSIYGKVVTENTVQFIVNQLSTLQEKAREYDYEVTLDYSYKEIQSIVESRTDESGGGTGAIVAQEDDGLIPGIDIDLSKLLGGILLLMMASGLST